MSETPILDLQCDPPRLHYNWKPILAGTLIGLALMRFVSLDSRWWFPALYLSIAVHEVGHLAAAKLVGMEAGGIVVGGLMIFKSGDHWLWRFDFRRILSGGLAKPLLKKGSFHLSQNVWMVAGGPLATLLLAAVCFLALQNSSRPSPWLSTLWWINLFLFASTFIPAGGLNKSDIPRLWQLLRNPEESRSWAALLQVQSEETAGVLPRDWDAELVALMLQPQGDNPYRQMLAFYRRMNEGREADALQHLERALSTSGKYGRPIRHWCFLEAACCSALLRGNPAGARIWLDRAIRLRKPLSRYSVDAAIAQSEGRYQDAIELWDASLAYVVKKRFDSGLTRFAQANIVEYRRQCQEALQTGRGTPPHRLGPSEPSSAILTS